MIKVIASDMDGTFLDSKGSYDRERFEYLLSQLEARGIRFVVASGNNMGRLSLMFEGLMDRLSFVADNGAHVIAQGKELVRHTMDRATVEDFLAYFSGQEAAYTISVTTATALYVVEGAHFPDDWFAIEPEQMALFLSRIKALPSFDQLPDEPILKVGMLLPEDQCEAILQDFNTNFPGRLTATTSGYGSVDVIETGVHKAWGLKHLLDEWGIAPQEVMAFGDGGNDIELLRLAGQSYAMANAPQVVQEAANDLAPHHNEAGVLTVIENRCLE